ncbi:2'-5' RNA ligase family protein [Nocardioides zeae]|uniref:2'-5' RNA ligase family protein n=1 Tax=Nocardioides imazamoxiresistens TaxID=3231893 RepID=A0ABU3PU60_9ACTN|nr:2'-5' RNA ligase family protein [Nocardioides zeae]MDT9592765.1 2'-5' RNA ligase family protein [Nocardioides zeae]
MPTIGVVFTIPEPWGSQLQDYRRGLGDATADLIPSHITLVPPTEATDEQVERLREHLRLVAGKHPRFRVHLRGTGTFRPTSPVVFVTVAGGIGECEQLAGDLRDGPLDVVLNFPYHPHVTVAHNLDDAALDRAFDDLVDIDAAFELERFHLYVQDPVEGWILTDDFALAERAGA